MTRILVALVLLLAVTTPVHAEAKKVHGLSETCHGVVVAVDGAAKTFSVRSDAGTVQQFALTQHTKGKPVVDQRVTVHFYKADGKQVASTITAAVKKP